jgi:LacI family transcriptional regulator
MKRMRKVILLIPSGREYERGILRGIVSYAQIHGPWMFYEAPPSYLNQPALRHRQAHMRAWNADGVIALETHAADSKFLHLPTVVLCGTRHPPLRTPQIRSDNEAIGAQGADYLRGLGLQHLAFCGLAKMEWSTDRCESFRRRANQLGIETHIYTPADNHSGESWYTEERQLGDWLAKLPKPIGLMACNDDRARMLADICQSRGIRVPDDIAILGADNDGDVCTRATPALSSMSLATERAGYETAALLDKLISGQTVKDRVIITHLVGVVTRQSTDLIASNDPDLVKAARFIRENGHRIIQVRDVAQAAGLSRRVLQDRFLKGMGRTVLEAIHQARVQCIKRLLAETNLPISAIAASIGCQTDAHLARFFSRKTGLTPSAYRRRHHKR